MTNDRGNFLLLNAIKRVKFGVYEVTLLNDYGLSLTTLSRIEVHEGIMGVNFDSREFHEHVMSTGYVYVRPICSAVKAFHEAQTLES